jgi:hypothetical protein
MKISTILAFGDEIEKAAGLSHGLELTGLGTLAYPSAKRVIKGKSTKEDKFELGGLGLLAGATMKSMLSKKAMVRAAEKLKLAADLWDPSSGNRSEEMHVRGSIIAKQKASPMSSGLKPASSIRGAPYKGAPVAMPKPAIATASSGFKPRMAPLGKLTAQATKPSGLFGKAMSFLGRK